MKLHYIGILRNESQPAHEIVAEKELSSYSRFTRNNYGEFMTLFAKTVAERTRPGQRQDVEEQDYTFHAYGRTEGVCGIIISDHQYPALVAHQLLSKVVDEFLSKNPRSSWATGTPTLSMPELKEYLTKYQDPQQADSILKIQKELDETKIVLHKTIESVLQRGEKIDDLVAKSDGLSAQSKMFYPSQEAELVLCFDVMDHFVFPALDLASFQHIRDVGIEIGYSCGADTSNRFAHHSFAGPCLYSS
ncbi:Longin-like domain-containing protein [Fusarium redolens]|uniref:Longin-like domain-containing protein n=1 Tax=Fusarium redolens TaxID=48865 RepID=A0A9P9H0X7_FUSRE|nr:Longin-like domain-containing protein [Fusarium redolens]KAH7249123.1 Longin-like domain-containing protein [Fusarium redolens]